MSTISNLKYDDRPMALDLTNLNIRRKTEDLIQLCKIVHGIDKIEINKTFPFVNNNLRGFKYYREIVRLPSREI